MDNKDIKPTSYMVLMDSKQKKEERKPVEPVLKEAPKIREKTFEEKLKEAINPARDLKEIRDHVVFDILIPSWKYNVQSSVMSLLEMFLFPNGVNPNRTTRPVSSGPAYREYYRQNNPVNPYNNPNPQRLRNDVYRYQDYGFNTREEAEDVLNGMWDIFNNSSAKVVTVGEYYELLRLPTNQTDFNYGWTSLSAIEPVQNYADGKYYLTLPKPMALS